MPTSWQSWLQAVSQAKAAALSLPPGPGTEACTVLEMTELVGGDVAVGDWMGDCRMGCEAAGLV